MQRTKALYNIKNENKQKIITMHTKVSNDTVNHPIAIIHFIFLSFFLSFLSIFFYFHPSSSSSSSSSSPAVRLHSVTAEDQLIRPARRAESKRTLQEREEQQHGDRKQVGPTHQPHHRRGGQTQERNLAGKHLGPSILCFPRPLVVLQQLEQIAVQRVRLMTCESAQEAAGSQDRDKPRKPQQRHHAHGDGDQGGQAYHVGVDGRVVEVQHGVKCEERSAKRGRKKKRKRK